MYSFHFTKYLISIICVINNEHQRRTLNSPPAQYRWWPHGGGHYDEASAPTGSRSSDILIKREPPQVQSLSVHVPVAIVQVCTQDLGTVLNVPVLILSLSDVCEGV